MTSKIQETMRKFTDDTFDISTVTTDDLSEGSTNKYFVTHGNRSHTETYITASALSDYLLNTTDTFTGTLTVNGALDVDTLNFNGNVITDSTGTISFGNEILTTTGVVNAQLFAYADATSYGTNYIAIGNGAKSASTGGYDIAIGSGALCSSYGGSNIAIGKTAVTGSFSGGQVQIGTGTNSVAGTFQWRNWLLMDNSGDIPEARISNALGSYATNIKLLDNVNLKCGTGGDAGFWYDGTDLHIDAQLVGSGNIILDNLPTSDPSTTGALFTQTATQLGGSGTTKVLCVS